MSPQASPAPARIQIARAWSFVTECRSNDPDIMRQGRIVAAILVVLILLSLAAFVSFMVHGSTLGESWLDILTAAVLVPVFFDNRRGNVRRSGLIILAIMLVAINGFAAVAMQDHVSHLAAGFLWVVPILFAGTILRWQVVCWTTALCVVNVWLLQDHLLGHAALFGSMPWTQRMMQCQFVLIVAGVFCAINRHQTDRYQLELRARNVDLDRANDELESEVRHRTRDLVAANNLALAASRVNSEILVNMSHELRTPMNAILGNTDLLLDTPLETRQREFAVDVRVSGGALLTMIDDMLEYSSLDMGGVKFDSRPFEVKQWLSTSIASLTAIAEAKGLAVSVQVDPDVPPVVLGDFNRLRRVLVNLVSNAIKFTKKGEISITISVGEHQTNRVRLRCIVRDTGIGIPTDQLHRVFKTFGQIDASLKRRTNGVGLGLALSKRLVERMGGRMTVTSKPGEGSVFAFEFEAEISQKESVVMAANADVPKSVVGNPVPVVAADVTSKASLCRILLAEDNLINQKVALAMLKKLGYDADLVGNGVLAVQAAEKKQYDVILMDVQMPEMDGLEATRTILARSDDARRPTIIGFTAHVLAADKEQCYAAGMVDIVAKPTELPMLRDAIERAMSRAA